MPRDKRSLEATKSGLVVVRDGLLLPEGLSEEEQKAAEPIVKPLQPNRAVRRAMAKAARRAEKKERR